MAGDIGGPFRRYDIKAGKGDDKRARRESNKGADA
jgi:hypothetical protein